MTEEILSVKLNEFDRLFTRMHDLIQTSNSFSRERLREEIRALSEEYAKNELHLRNSLRQSKATVQAKMSGEVLEVLFSAGDTVDGRTAVSNHRL